MKELGHNLAFALHSDPLLEFVTYLCCFLALSILSFIFIIIYKHYKRQSQLRHQALLYKHIQFLLEHPLSDQPAVQRLYQLNKLIQKKPLQTLTAWMDVMQDADVVTQEKYAAVLRKLDYQTMIQRGLASRHIALQCLAMQMIRLCHLKQFDDYLLVKLASVELAPYAIAALAKIQGIAALKLILNAYEKDLLSNSQLLTAIAELPRAEVLAATSKRQHAKIHGLITRYLGAAV